jgi:hypothetical protein
MNIRKDIMIRPKCKCHGIEMIPRADSGTWRCRIKARTANKKYRLSGRAKVHDRKYNSSEHGKRKNREHRKKYWNSLSQEEKDKKIMEFKTRIAELEEDILWRLKRDTKSWQRKLKRATYL